MVEFNLVFAKIQKTHHTAKRYATYFIDKSTSKVTTTRIVSLSSLFSYPE